MPSLGQFGSIDVTHFRSAWCRFCVWERLLLSYGCTSSYSTNLRHFGMLSPFRPMAHSTLKRRN
jgi:hypothetical protein